MNLFFLIKEDSAYQTEFIKIFNYLLELGSFDLNPSIREFTRMIKYQTAKENAINPEIFKSFDVNLLKILEKEREEDDPNYGFLSTIAKDKVEGIRLLPSKQERNKENTTHLREPPKEEKKTEFKEKTDVAQQAGAPSVKEENIPAPEKRPLPPSFVNKPASTVPNQLGSLLDEKDHGFFDDDEDDGN